jgi:hypothetical protein
MLQLANRFMGCLVVPFHMAGAGTPLRVVIIAVFTAIETAALAIWLQFVRGEPIISTAVAIGLGVLVIGLIVEHVFTDFAVSGVDLDFPFGAIVILSVSETVLWGIWLEVVEIVGGRAGLVVAFGILVILLVPQHTFEDNILQGHDLLSDVIALGTVGISLIEAIGATIWLALVLQPGLVGGSIAGVDAALVGLGILGIALFIEHNIGVRFSKR